MSALDLALIGNSSVAALLDARARIVWSCLPRFDSDPAFCALLRAEDGTEDRKGMFEVDLADFERSEQAYIAHTPILRTRLYDRHGGGVEITDLAPRFQQFGRLFCPVMLMRQVRPIAGSPRIRVRIRPLCEYGARRPAMTWGSNHVRYVMPEMDLRLTTDFSITAILEETQVVLREPVSLVLGPDETLHTSPGEAFRRFLDDTAAWWRDWVRGLAISFEWQEQIIRAAITLKLNAYEDTGAIVAAVTTSIPESPGSGRNWDYRYCWLRDAYFVVNALNRLNATSTMERFLDFIINTAAGTNGADLQPVYAVTGKAGIAEREAPALPGYRGMGPVRVGNQAYSQNQHDVYGAAVLAAAHVFFDARLALRSDQALFRRLEQLGERAATLYDKPDAGPWELRGTRHVHTFSSVMCWAACDRLAKIAARIGLEERARHWHTRADTMHAAICERAWSAKRSSFAATFGGEQLDASLLLLRELDFLRADDPRFAATVRAVEKDLRRGDFVFRYTQPDDFGVPDNAFVVCTFWYVDALAALGRTQEARTLFESLLARCNQHGLLSEHIEPATGELWGNFPQTYSMVGLINSAMRLSISWDQAF
ncbi:MAG TPA: glycoside hydrolase family 15 protein [Burkholderiales bacterium]|nr:glycoside hydrolase family 15 protein [Burkholderiales bacterium]